MAFTHKARVRLPDCEILFGFERFRNHVNLAVTKYSIQSAQTTIKHEALEIFINYIPVGLAVRICGFHPQGPGSTPGLENFVRIEHFRKPRYVWPQQCTQYRLQKTATKHEALETLINKIPVGLAVRICGFHPQGPVRRPDWEIMFGLSVLETTLHLAVTKYSIPSAQTTIKHEALEILINNIPVGLAIRICGSHPQGPGWTPGLGKFVRIERFRNHVTFGRNKVLDTVCTNHNQTRGAGN